jgi:hypothetical protein
MKIKSYGMYHNSLETGPEQPNETDIFCVLQFSGFFGPRCEDHLKTQKLSETFIFGEALKAKKPIKRFF